MANNIALANKILPILDEIYKKGAATSVFDARVMTNAFTGVNEIKVLKVGTVGLGTTPAIQAILKQQLKQHGKP